MWINAHCVFAVKYKFNPHSFSINANWMTNLNFTNFKVEWFFKLFFLVLWHPHIFATTTRSFAIVLFVWNVLDPPPPLTLLFRWNVGLCLHKQIEIKLRDMANWISELICFLMLFREFKWVWKWKLRLLIFLTATARENLDENYFKKLFKHR